MRIQSGKCFAVAAFFITALVACPAVALAQDASDGAADADTTKPWNKGVPVAERDKAQAIFEQGNYHFERSGYSKALAEYRKAIEIWDHPAIRYNIAICLMQLDQPIEAHDHLQKSLSFGEEPLGKRLFAEGKLHQKNLAARLSVVVISTKEEGARVTLDGDELFVGPGSVERVVLGKKHQIVASKKGMLTLTEEFIPEGGKTSKIHLKLEPLSDNVVLVRRWDTWKPWAVVGGGLVAGALGGTFYLLSSQNIDDYDQGILAACPTGCPDDHPDVLRLQSKKDRSDLQNKLMVGSLTVGGLAVTTGLVLAFMNRPRVQRRKDASTTNASSPRVRVTPILGAGTGGAVTELSWRF